MYIKIRKTAQYYLKQLARGYRAVRWSVFPCQIGHPVFVVGCSRAGTTLIYKTLSESSQIGSLQKETHDFWEDLHPLSNREWKSHVLTPDDISVGERERVSKYFYVQCGKRRFVDKNNQNGFCVEFLAQLYPDAKFIFVTRNPGDNIRSLMQGWRKPEEFGTWSDNLPATVAIEDGSVDRWCFFLPEGWRAHTDSSLARVCAFQYDAMNRAILSGLSGLPSERAVQLQYEAILKDPVGAFRKLFEFADLGFSPDIETHCRNILDKPYNTFSAIGVDKWRGTDDADAIDGVLKHVTDIAKTLGY